MPVVVVTAALLAVALASRVVPPKYGRDQPGRPVAESAASRTPSALPTVRRGQGHTTTHPLAVTIPAYVLLGIVAAGLVWALVTVLTTRLRAGRRARRRVPRPGTGVAADRLAARLEAVVGESMDDLADGPVTDAIIACWLRLQDAAGGAGIALHRSDTPTETVVRVLGEGTRRVRAEPLQALADLYREARFSRHELGEPDRARARSALEQIRAQLAGDVTPAGHGVARA